MHLKNHRNWKLWPVMLAAVVLWTLAVGSQRDLIASSEETYRGLKTFSDVIEIVEKTYVDPVDTKDLMEKAIQGMVNSLDPHSSLLPPEAYEELQIETKGEFTGIGISITIRDGFVTVISPIEGTPAYKAGIKALDRIVRVDGEVTRDLRDAVNRMRGPKGTAVVVTVVREGVSDPIEFKLVRDLIPIVSVRSAILKPGFGYVWVTNFRDQTTEDLDTALREMESGPEGLKGLVLDLRDNPGGLLPQAISISDLFLESGAILSIKGRQEKHTNVYQAKPSKIRRDYPMVVLINGGSASASEIVAGALQDNKRALILGTTSFGKGSVQTIESLRDGYGLKLTVARYFTPSGRSIQATGIEPDIVVQPRKIEKDAKETAENKRIKEKDLRNHLRAIPDGSGEEEKSDDKSEKEPGTDSDKLKKVHRGALDETRLKNDNQVMQALDILISHHILSQK